MDLKLQIVIARYSENISWITLFKDITIIYNKGGYNDVLSKFNVIQIPNVGRESHTYLYHIINNYDNLADRTVFFQGKIDDHNILPIEDYFKKDDFIGKTTNLNMDKLKNKIDHIDKWKIDAQNGNMKLTEYTPYDWIVNIVGISLDENIKTSKIVWGANFSLSREIIHRKPKIFYENIIRYFEYHINQEIGHYMERAWYLIFNNLHIEKKKIGYKTPNRALPDNIESFGFNEIHIWSPIMANYELGINHPIYYTPNNNKYLMINPIIINNKLSLNIKAYNDAHILIELKNNNIYEIVFGGWSNNRSVIRDFKNGKIVGAIDHNILNKNKFIKFDIELSENIIVLADNDIIFNLTNIFEKSDIKYVNIKSYFGSDAYWDYEHNGDSDTNFKYFMCCNTYDDIKYYYSDKYMDSYVSKI